MVVKSKVVRISEESLATLGKYDSDVDAAVRKMDGQLNYIKDRLNDGVRAGNVQLVLGVRDFYGEEKEEDE